MEYIVIETFANSDEERRRAVLQALLRETEGAHA